jgi:hypothetical protein
MTNNLLAYLPKALRKTGDTKSVLKPAEAKNPVQNKTQDSYKNRFLVDSRFSLRLDELA